MKWHNLTAILYRYPFYHSTLEFWLRCQCQHITPSTYKYVRLLFPYILNNGAFSVDNYEFALHCLSGSIGYGCFVVSLLAARSLRRSLARISTILYYSSEVSF